MAVGEVKKAQFFGFQRIFHPQCIEKVKTGTASCERKTLEIEKTYSKKVKVEVERPRKNKFFNGLIGPKTETRIVNREQKKVIEKDYLACSIDLKNGEKQELQIFLEDGTFAVSDFQNNADQYQYRGKNEIDNFVFSHHKESIYGSNIWLYQEEGSEAIVIDQALTGDIDEDGDQDIILQIGEDYGAFSNQRLQLPKELFAFGAILAYSIVFPFFPDLKKAAEESCFWQMNFGEPLAQDNFEVD